MNYFIQYSFFSRALLGLWAMLLAFNVWGAGKSGYSDLRLLFINQETSAFNPNRDLLKASEEEKKSEKVKQALVASLYRSLIPLIPHIRFQDKDMGEEIAFKSLLGYSRQFKDNLTREFQKIPATLNSDYKMILVPFGKIPDDLFYNSNKISIPTNDLLNVLKPSENFKSFEEETTQEIKKLQAQYFQQGPKRQEQYLLSLSARLKVERGQPKLYLRALIGLRPKQEVFNEQANGVKLDHIVIPSIPSRDTCASIIMVMDLSGRDSTYPLYVDFGDFEKFEDGEFIINQKTKNLYALKLVGHITKAPFQSVTTHFAIGQVEMDLKSRKVQDLYTYTSFGLDLFGKKLSLGGIHLGRVDHEFRNEINSSIDQRLADSIGEALTGLNQKIISKTLGEGSL